MKLDPTKISNGDHDGENVWITDYRYNSINEKPIRHVKPTKCIILNISESKKNIYYSNSFFRAYNAKGMPAISSTIGLYDNTGFRSRSGTPVQVFDNEDECKKAYLSMYKANLERKRQWLASVQAEVDAYEALYNEARFKKIDQFLD